MIQFSHNEHPRGLTFTRILEEFEGPILSEYRAEIGSGHYIEKWCAKEGNTNRYLLVRTELRAIAEYLAGKITLLNLINDYSDGGGYILDRVNNQVTDSYSVRLSELPAEYLPSDQAKHDVDLRPNWEMTSQSYLINTDWDAKLFAKIERQYLSASAFAFFTEEDTDRRLPDTVLMFDYDGGFPIMHLNNHIRQATPINMRAKCVGVAAASPGILTIDSPSSVVLRLQTALSNLGVAKTTYKELHDWAKTKIEDADTIPTADDSCADLQALCDDLKININSLFPAPTDRLQYPMRHKKSILTAAKLAAAYYRSLKRVLNPEENVEFIGM